MYALVFRESENSRDDHEKLGAACSPNRFIKSRERRATSAGACSGLGAMRTTVAPAPLLRHRPAGPRRCDRSAVSFATAAACALAFTTATAITRSRHCSRRIGVATACPFLRVTR